jgi:hypothetical protein
MPKFCWEPYGANAIERWVNKLIGDMKRKECGREQSSTIETQVQSGLSVAQTRSQTYSAHSLHWTLSHFLVALTRALFKITLTACV